MNTLKNRVQLLGNVGNDPEIRTFEDGKKLVTFSIATNESYKTEKGEKIEDTQWHYVKAWGKTGEIIEKYVIKGKEVAVAGRLVHREYESKTGEKRYITEILLSEILLLGK